MKNTYKGHVLHHNSEYKGGVVAWKNNDNDFFTDMRSNRDFYIDLSDVNYKVKTVSDVNGLNLRYSDILFVYYEESPTAVFNTEEEMAMAILKYPEIVR